jgi:cytochrome c oxidase subunit 3
LAEAILDEQFVTLEQQHETRLLGMWIFLMTELMLFGAMFTMYIVYRAYYPDAFAEASQHLDLVLASLNTGVLIVSSLLFALAVHQAQTRANRAALVLLLLGTASLGALFIVIKGYEYYLHYVNGEVPGLNWSVQGLLAGPVQLFFWLYFAMTGVHAIHLLVGIGLVGIMILRAGRGDFTPNNYTPLEISGLYWHFVDIVWIFLLPMLYLLGTHTRDSLGF